jgi:hypothetical protein
MALKWGTVCCRRNSQQSAAEGTAKRQFYLNNIFNAELNSTNINKHLIFYTSIKKARTLNLSRLLFLM